MNLADRSIRLVLVLVVSLGTVVLLGALRAEAMLNGWQTNLTGATVLDWLAYQNAPMAANAESIWDAACTDYPTTIAALHTAEYESLLPEQQLLLLSQIGSCWAPERRSMLALWTGRAQWELALFAEVCDTLVAMDAPSRLLELAKESQYAGNWPAVEAALECMRRFSPEGAWVSPFIVAQLYHGLGQHYEEQGKVDEAIAAYDAAASWYPVVWAAPYLSKASLLWQRGDTEDAVQWLVNGVSGSVDVTATFYLWRDLGGYWEQQDNLRDAACAYRNAASLMAEVPLSNLTVLQRDQLRARINALDLPPPSTCFASYQQLHANQAGD